MQDTEIPIRIIPQHEIQFSRKPSSISTTSNSNQIKRHRNKQFHKHQHPYLYAPLCPSKVHSTRGSITNFPARRSHRRTPLWAIISPQPLSIPSLRPPLAPFAKGKTQFQRHQNLDFTRSHQKQIHEMSREIAAEFFSPAYNDENALIQKGEKKRRLRWRSFSSSAGKVAGLRN